MNHLFVILLIVSGLLAASSLVLAKAPNAKSLFDKVVPLSGWIGIVLLVISLIYTVKYVLPHIGTMLTSFAGIVAIATVVVGTLLGFLLGFGLIASWVGGKSPEALAKGERLRARLSLMQIPLGIAGVVLAIYSLV